MSPKQGFAIWFRAALDAKGVSAGEFAKSAHISRSAAYFYRSGHRLPTTGVVAKIARTLGIATEDLPTFVYGKPGRPRSTAPKAESVARSAHERNQVQPSESLIAAR